jgi:branched-chain amino acid transport system substrate-binding protein
MTQIKWTTGRADTNRRQLLRMGAASAIAFASPRLLAQTAKPIRIGVVLTFSRVYASICAQMYNGMLLYFNSRNMEIAGRKIEMIKEDDEVNPQVGLQKIRKLVESDDVDIVVGPLAGNIAMAAVGYFTETPVPWIPYGAVTELTHKRLPYMFRPSTSTWQTNAPMGKWLFEQGHKEVVLASSDYASGHDALENFKSTFVPAGGKVLKEVYAPLGTNDYAAYLADLKATNAAALYCFFAGTDAVRFVNQFGELGLKGNMLLTGSGYTFDADALPAQGRNALGALSGLHYAESLDTPVNKKFLADYQAAFNQPASVYSDYGYVAARVIGEALDKTEGDTDKDKLAAAMINVKFDAPRGPFEFDPINHNVVQNFYVRQVAEENGKMINKVITTIPGVRDPIV